MESNIAAWVAVDATKNDKKIKAMEEVAVKSACKVQKTLTPASFVNNDYVVQAVLYSIVLGYLPLDFVNNTGLRH